MKKVIVTILMISLSSLLTQAQIFKVSFADSLSKKSFTGPVILYMSKEKPEPKKINVGIDIAPCFRFNVVNIKPGVQVSIDDHAVSYPVPLSQIERGVYYVQVVWDRNLGGQSIGKSPGNYYSVPEKVVINGDAIKVYSLIARKVIAEPVFKSTEYIKEIKVKSSLLSKFYEKPTTINAAVHLPKEYITDPTRKFPVKLIVSGFGDNYHRFGGINKPMPPTDTIPCIGIYLDGNCPSGHSAYANSENNGPWGDALIKEFIPELEKEYRCNGARLLNGHSSGGWTVLWLQTHYPSIFAGCWSSSPDPVDFRSFIKVDLYQNQNMFYGKDSSLNALGTIAGYFPWFTLRAAYQMENVIYRGEQMHSFNAVFGTKGVDGLPLKICNEITGEINPVAFEHWKAYDISLYLRNNWTKIKKDLNNKIFLCVGNQDNFQLNYAVQLLEDEMKKIGAGVQVKYYPGDHFTLATPEFVNDGNSFLARKYKDWLR